MFIEILDEIKEAMNNYFLQRKLKKLGKNDKANVYQLFNTILQIMREKGKDLEKISYNLIKEIPRNTALSQVLLEWNKAIDFITELQENILKENGMLLKKEELIELLTYFFILENKIEEIIKHNFDRNRMLNYALAQVFLDSPLNEQNCCRETISQTAYSFLNKIHPELSKAFFNSYLDGVFSVKQKEKENGKDIMFVRKNNSLEGKEIELPVNDKIIADLAVQIVKNKDYFEKDTETVSNVFSSINKEEFENLPVEEKVDFMNFLFSHDIHSLRKFSLFFDNKNFLKGRMDEIIAALDSIKNNPYLTPLRKQEELKEKSFFLIETAQKIIYTNIRNIIDTKLIGDPLIEEFKKIKQENAKVLNKIKNHIYPSESIKEYLNALEKRIENYVEKELEAEKKDVGEMMIG